MPTIPSKKQWEDDRPKFPIIKQDDYLLRVLEAKPTTQPKYMKPSEEEEIVKIIFEVLETRDGDCAMDVNDGDATGRKLFFTARPNNIGFKEKGTVPSITREFLAYITEQEIFGEIFYNDFEEFVGKTILAQVNRIEYEGKLKNKIIRFIPKKKKATINPAIEAMRNKEKDKAREKEMEGIPVIEETGDGHYKGEPKKLDLGADNAADQIDVKDIPF